jgi:hypothetical protein
MGSVKIRIRAASAGVAASARKTNGKLRYARINTPVLPQRIGRFTRE